MAKVIFEYVAPTGAGKTYSVNSLLGAVFIDSDIRTRKNDDLDADSSIKRTCTRLKYLVTLLAYNPKLTVQCLYLVYKFNEFFTGMNLLSRLKLSFSLLYNFAYIYTKRDKDTIILLDQGLYQLVCSFAARSDPTPTKIDKIVELMTRVLPENYYAVTLDYDIHKLSNKLRNRGNYRDGDLNSLFYGSEQKILKTERLFLELLTAIRMHGKVIKHTEIEKYFYGYGK